MMKIIDLLNKIAKRRRSARKNKMEWGYMGKMQKL